MAKGKVSYWLTSDGLTLLAGWAREGLTDEQIATNMKIVPSTLYEWKKKYPEISETLKKNKEIVDYEVENALLKRAKGYSYKEITKEFRDGEVVITKIVQKEVAPDTGAAMAWLKNRQPNKWREKSKELLNEDEGVIIVNDSPK